MYWQPIVGAIIFGILTIVLGWISGFVIRQFHKSALPVDLPKECEKWNQHYFREHVFFLTGVLAYVVSFIAAKYVK